MQKILTLDGPTFHVYTYQKAFLHFGTSLHKMISSVQNIVTDMRYTCNRE